MMSSSVLAGQVVVVTGAGAGLGKELALQLAPLGVQLELVDRDCERVGLVAAEVRAAGGTVNVHTCDITDLTQIEAVLAKVDAAHGRIDVLVNNAGIWTDNQLESVDPERRHVAFAVNAIGPIQFTHAALPLLRRSDVTQIVNVISASGAGNSESSNNQRWMTYGATKGALANFTESLTAELAPEGIKVIGIFPGGFESDMYESAESADEHHDAPWMMRTEDIAEILVFAMTRPRDVQIERLLVTKRGSRVRD